MAENKKTNLLIGERIRDARKRKDPSVNQEQLAEKLGVTFQAVSNWETGKFIPDSDHLPALAKELDLSLDALFAEEEHTWELNSVNFDADHMFTFVKGRAQMIPLKDTLAVIELLRKAHSGQHRKSNHGFEVPYITHPLTLACHALAMNLRDDTVIAACLAHDMIEDSHGRVTLSDLPENEALREAVRLVSKNLCDQSDPDWEETYYGNIRKNPLACLIKCLDRCNNLSCMADGFSREKMAEYTAETDRYYPGLLDVIKKVPEWNDAWWLLRYQMTALTETFKRML